MRSKAARIRPTLLLSIVCSGLLAGPSAGQHYPTPRSSAATEWEHDPACCELPSHGAGPAIWRRARLAALEANRLLAEEQAAQGQPLTRGSAGAEQPVAVARAAAGPIEEFTAGAAGGAAQKTAGQALPAGGGQAPAASAPKSQDPGQDQTGGQASGAEVAPAQDGTPEAAARDLPIGQRERVWFAPTAADWAKPCLVPFQRTWEDALTLSQETGRPILVCVNMDGEIASEHYAGVRYRQPDIAALYEPYVCVIASVYRHTPRDHDERGQRVLCPRFGSVTCGEHIAIEPILFERFFDGVRVAPRHIMVELDGSEQYDVYYALDTDSVFKRIQTGISDRASEPRPAIRGDRSVLERVASPDNRDRSAVEQAYLEADPAGRRALLEAALAAKDAASADLLRLAVFGLDSELASLARQSLAQRESEDAVELIGEALGTPLPAPEQEALVAALDRLGARSERARTLAAVQRAAKGGGSGLDPEAWRRRLAEAPAKRASFYEVAYGASAAARGAADASAGTPAPSERAQQLLEQARAFIEHADSGEADARYMELLRADAARFLAAISAMGFESFESRALSAYLADRRGDAQAAQQLGAAALLALSGDSKGAAEAAAGSPAKPADADSRGGPLDTARLTAALEGLDPALLAHPATALVLSGFAAEREAQIRRAQRERQPWPESLLAEVNAAYELLSKHPAGRPSQAARHYEFLWTLGAKRQALSVLERGVQRFLADGELHQRYRAAFLITEGPEGLERRYDALLALHPQDASLLAQVAYGDLVLAEHQRRTRPEGWPAKALAAYDRGAGRYLALEGAQQRSGSSVLPNPEELLASDAAEAERLRREAAHYRAMAEAGAARVLFELGDDPACVERLLRSFELAPRSSNLPDGLNLTAVDTAKLALTRLRQGAQLELAARLEAGLESLRSLDPTLLDLPAYERAIPR
jgi:hypothetical protein